MDRKGAVDDDPGVEVTLTLSGFSAQKVVVIDVLNGFERELVSSTEGGNLIISNLLVKDYSIILCLTPQVFLPLYRRATSPTQKACTIVQNVQSKQQLLRLFTSTQLRLLLGDFKLSKSSLIIYVV